MTWNEENDILIKNQFDIVMNKISQKNKKYKVLELYITDVCNQKCEYCYLIKHQNELYPKEYRSQETILNNLKIFLNYLLENNYDSIPEFSIFTGEIWHTDFGLKVLEEIYNYCLKAKNPPFSIMIPSNFTFILNDNQTQKIEEWINKFGELKTYIHFSCSIDGLILENKNRPFNDLSQNYIKNQEEHYEKIFKWCKKMCFGFHPMVNSYSIEDWKEQYKWWIDKFVEHGFDVYKNSMFLEVRNDEWTHDKIFSYLDYLNFATDYLLNKYFNKDYIELLHFMLNINLPVTGNYVNVQLLRQSYGMCIRLGDLSWVPCHRTSYEPFVYGKFKVENGKIVGLEGKNTTLATAIYSLGYKGHPKCDTCAIGDLCLRGCYGAQFESNQELFYPCSTVCDLFFAKNLFLYYKIKKIISDYQVTDKIITNAIQDLYVNYISKISEEEIEKWMPKIKHLMMN